MLAQSINEVAAGDGHGGHHGAWFCSRTLRQPRIWRVDGNAVGRRGAAPGGAGGPLAATAKQASVSGWRRPLPKSSAAEPVILGEGGYRYRVVEGWGGRRRRASPIGTAQRCAWIARTTSTYSTAASIR